MVGFACCFVVGGLTGLGDDIGESQCHQTNADQRNDKNDVLENHGVSPSFAVVMCKAAQIPRYCPIPGFCNNSIMMFWPRSEEHTSELQSLMRISYAVFCFKKKIE